MFDKVTALGARLRCRSSSGRKAIAMHIDGRCHCGAITYEADIDADDVAVCHCTDCQTLSGTAFRTLAGCEASRFRLLTGEPRIYIKVAESGSRRAQAFCPECGTPLYATDADRPGAPLSLRLGAVIQRDALVPKIQLWSRSALTWLQELGDVPKIEKEEGLSW